MLRRKSATNPCDIPLLAELKVGRDADNDLRIPRESVSGRHAVLRWTSSGWVLRDASRYGTLINGTILKSASRVLTVGDELTFVERDEVWILVDAGPPGLQLRPLGATDLATIWVDSSNGLLALPSPSSPAITVLQVDDTWFIELESGERREVRDGATIDLLGVTYAVSAPRLPAETAEPQDPATRWSLESVSLDLTVLRGEDEAEITVRAGATERSLRPSRPLYLLAYLAEQRSKEQAEMDAKGHGEHADGWLPTQLACEDLSVDRTSLNVDVHRVREAMKLTGLANAVNIIERRPSQIRIGVAAERLQVTRR